jgi:hypothetical protein
MFISESNEHMVRVIEILSDEARADSFTLRMDLFVAAAESPKAEACLMPFPACFYGRVKEMKLFQELWASNAGIPALSDLNDETELPNRTWELLYWIPTNPGTIPVPITPDITNNLSAETGLSFDFPI